MNIETVKRLFVYKDGQLIRRISTGGQMAGTVVGCLQADGYRTVKILRKNEPVHRVIFFLHHGYIPEQIDHIDGDRQNNRIENLRPATHVTNGYNRKLGCNSTSGVKGVVWHRSNKKWQVRINVNGKRKAFGYYDELELAELVAVEARNKYHGIYANHR